MVVPLQANNASILLTSEQNAALPGSLVWIAGPEGLSRDDTYKDVLMTPSPSPIAVLHRELPRGSDPSGNKKARPGFHRACFGSDQNNSLKRPLQLERGE